MNQQAQSLPAFLKWVAATTFPETKIEKGTRASQAIRRAHALASALLIVWPASAATGCGTLRAFRAMDNRRGQARARTLLTDFAYHRPPRGVLMPHALRASAIWCSDVAPARCISRITGSTLVAWRSASALIDAVAD
jgi:hypothetical protein